MVEKFEVGDIIALVAYFALVLAVGLLSTFRSNKDSATGYFLAGKSMHWIPVGASLFASNVGAPMFIGLAGAAAASGYSVVVYEWHAIYLLIALGWIFVPVYVSSRSFTMPEYLHKRFGGNRLRIYLSVLALLLYVLTRISSEIYTGALFIQLLVGWNLYYCITGILGVTAIYTVIGGLTAVIYTDTLQTVILLIGASILTIKGFQEVGGLEGLQEKYPYAASNQSLGNSTVYACGLPRDDAFHIWRDPLQGDIPWPGAFTGLTILGLWVWCSDQIIVQRSLSAKNMVNAKGGSLFAAALKIFPFFLWIIPGMISRVLFPDEVACSSPEKCYEVCQNPAGCSNIAYPLLVLRILPMGVRGLMIAAVLAAQMSTLTSIFNSASSMFTMDIWTFIRRTPSDNEMMVVGRITSLILVGLGIVWLPILQQSQGGQLWAYLQSIAAFTAPPWTMVFLFGMFWTRTTEQGAFWGLIVGMVTGLPRLCMEFIFPAPFCGSGEEDDRPAILKEVHFLYFAVILSIISSVVIVIVSLKTEPRSPDQLKRVTWWTRHEEVEESDTEEEEDVTDPGDNCVDTDQTDKRFVCLKVDESNGSYTSMEKIQQPNQSTGKRLVSKVIRWMCGFHSGRKVELSKKEARLLERKLTSLDENKKISSFLNAGAILLATLTAFLLGFYDSR